MVWWMWLALCASGLTLLLAALLVVHVLRLCKGLIESLRPVMLRQLELLDKTTALAASKDVLAFQGIQVMNSHSVGYPGEDYDPSDAAEARREAERQGMDPEELTDGDQEALTAAFS